jgi:DNA-binding NarL/FixJ family response regulator
MDQSKVFIVGNSLYSAGIERILTNSATVEIIGRCSTLPAALPLLKTVNPDVIIVANLFEKETINAVGALVTLYSHIPILRMDLSTDKLQVITSRRLSASSSELVATIAALSKNLVGGTVYE